MENIDYNELLCEAMQNLLEAQLQKIKFDQTIVCTIVDNTNKDEGKYTVSNGSIVFEATSDTTSYMNNEQVYVLIPQGDYSAQKTIISRYKNQDEVIEAFARADATIVRHNYKNFIPYGQKVSIPVKNINKVILSGEFRNLKSVEDRYGLVAELYLNNSTEKYIPVLLDSQTNMFGNPKEFLWFSKQSVTDDLIAYADQDAIITKIVITRFDEIQSLEIRNVSLDLCYDISTANGLARLEIQASSYAGYSSSDPKRSFTALYFDGSKGQELDNVQWQKKKNDQWINIDIIEFDSEARATSIRAVYTDSEIEIISNVLTFENLNATNNKHEAFYISLGENSSPYYPYYDENNQIIPSQQYKDRKITVTLKDYYTDKSLIGDEIIWYVPKTATMLEGPKDPTPVEEGDYYKYTLAIGNKEDPISEFTYRIKDYYQPNWTNNTLKCQIKYGDSINELSYSFGFSSRGNSGTDYTLLIVNEDGYRGWVNNIHGTDTPLVYRAYLYSPEGEDLSEDKEFTWSYSDSATSAQGREYSITTTPRFTSQLSVSTSIEYHNTRTTLTKKIGINYALENKDYYSTAPLVVRYDYAGNLITSPKSYAIQLLDNDNTGLDNANINVSVEVYEKTDKTNHCYTVTDKNTSSESDSSQIKFIKQYAPSFDTATNTLTFSNMCSIDFIKKYSLTLKFKPYEEGSSVIYAQPILLEYDAYASNILNDWSGDLVVDEEGNKILTAFMAAGTKDINNKFTGVLLGDIGQSDGITGSGIIGMQGGVQTFNLDTKGTVSIGKAGNGQIKIDGNGGIIESATDTGMKINLAEGTIEATNFTLEADTGNRLYLTNNGADDEPEFYIGDDDQYLSFSRGYLSINVNKFNLNASNILILNSSPSANTDPYFQIGNTNSAQIKFTKEGNLSINADNFNLTGTNLKLTNTEFNIGTATGNHITYDANGLDVNLDGLLDITAEKLNVSSNNFKLNTDTTNTTIPYFQIGASSSNHIIYKKDGTLAINLKDIAINTKTFNLNAEQIVEVPNGDEVYTYTNKIILNNNPSNTGYYFYAGNQEASHISFSKSGVVDIKSQCFNLNTFDNQLLLTNSGTNNKPQFKIGTNNEYIHFENDKLDIQVSDLRIAPNNTNGIMGAQNGFTPWICNPGTLEYPKVSDVTWDADKNAYKLTVYKQSDKAYGGMLIAYDCSYLIGKGSFNLSGKFYLPYQDDAPWSDVAVCFGYKNTPSLYDENTPFINPDLLEVSGGAHYQYSTSGNGLLNWDGDTAFAHNDIEFTSNAKYLIFLVQCIHKTERQQKGVSYSTPFEFYIKDLQLVKSDGTTIDLTNDRLNSVYDRLTHLSPSYSDGIFMSNGHLAINASAISTGILSSQNGNLAWDLNDGDLVLAENGYFVKSPSYSIDSEGIKFEETGNKLTTTAFQYYTPQYQERIGTGVITEPDYYYVTSKALKGLITIRSYANPDIQSSKTIQGQEYRLETNENGGIIVELKRGTTASFNAYCYIIRFPNDPARYIAVREFNDGSVFDIGIKSNGTIMNNKQTETKIVSGGSAVTYSGNKIVLSDEGSAIVLSVNDGETGIAITGEGITTWGNYSMPG